MDHGLGGGGGLGGEEVLPVADVVEEGGERDGWEVHGRWVGEREEFLVDFVGHADDAEDVGEVVGGVVVGHMVSDVGGYGFDEGCGGHFCYFLVLGLGGECWIGEEDV